MTLLQRRYLQLLVYALIIWSAVVYYGHMKEFEAALNAAETVTPLMLKEGIQSVTSYTMFLVLLLLTTRK